MAWLKLKLFREGSLVVLRYYDNKDHHQRSQQIKSEPLWIRPVKRNFVFIYWLMFGTSYSSASTLLYSMIHPKTFLAIPRTYTNICQTFFVSHYLTILNRLLVSFRCREFITQFKSLVDEFISQSGLCHLLDINEFSKDLYKQGPLLI